jgi:hypothetical protein
MFGRPLNPPRGKLIGVLYFDLLSLIVVLHLCTIGKSPLYPEMKTSPFGGQRGLTNFLPLRK